MRRYEETAAGIYSVFADCRVKPEAVFIDELEARIFADAADALGHLPDVETRNRLARSLSDLASRGHIEVRETVADRSDPMMSKTSAL